MIVMMMINDDYFRGATTDLDTSSSILALCSEIFSQMKSCWLLDAIVDDMIDM